MSREREKMEYWSQINKKQPMYKPPEKIYCKLCGTEIKHGSYSPFVDGIGIICNECWRKRSRFVK
jgi:hypothetical protein